MSTRYAYPPPSDGKPFRLIMGLRELEPREWFEAGDDVAEQLHERGELINSVRETVFQVLPGYESQLQEFIDLIMANIKEFHDEYSVEGTKVTHIPTGNSVDLSQDHPLLQLGKVICEDLCLMAKIEKEWRLVAGIVVFPSRWDLRSKIGKNIDEIHAPVPGYSEALQPYMSATFDKIKSGRPVWRRNWSLHSTSDLHQPISIHQTAAAENFWWRTERQTLTRLGDSDFLLFTIRNRAEPLSWIKADPVSAAAFAETLLSMSNETLEYKSLVDDRAKIIEYLRS